MARQARRGRLPTNGTIELTHRCPLACAHCYNNLPVGDARRAPARARHRRATGGSSTRSPRRAACGCCSPAARSSRARTSSRSTPTPSSAGLLVSLFTNGTQVTAGDRRLPRGLAAVRDRDNALRPHARDLRAADRRPRLVRSLHARDPAAPGARAAAEAEDRRGDHQPARDRRHAAVRRGGAGRRRSSSTG